MKSIKELQDVIDEIDKNIDLMEEQYYKISYNTEERLEYSGEEEISYIIKDIKSKAGIDENDEAGVNIGFYRDEKSNIMFVDCSIYFE